MSREEGVLRLAREEDARALLEVYAPYVENTTVSFEYQVPTEEEFARRIKETLAGFPYLVLEQGKRILGYAYAHPYAVRPAYQWGAELTVYLCPEACGKGLGPGLYRILFELLRLQGVRTVYGCITGENAASIAMHRAMGFHERRMLPTKQVTSWAAGWMCTGWKRKSPPIRIPSPVFRFHSWIRCKWKTFWPDGRKRHNKTLANIKTRVREFSQGHGFSDVFKGITCFPVQ